MKFKIMNLAQCKPLFPAILILALARPFALEASGYSADRANRLARRLAREVERIRELGQD